MKPNKSYVVALIVLVFWMVFASAIRFLMLNQLEGLDDSLVLAMQVVIAIDLLYAVFCSVVIIARSKKLSYAATLTRVLNILLLFNFPLGTALGLYGLIKVDK